MLILLQSMGHLYTCKRIRGGGDVLVITFVHLYTVWEQPFFRLSSKSRQITRNIKRLLFDMTYSWHPPITPILPSCPLWEQFTRGGTVSLTSSRQLHCFLGDLTWLLSVADLKRPLSLFSPPAKVLRLSMRNRNFVILLRIKRFFCGM